MKEENKKSMETTNLTELIREHSQMFNTTQKESSWAIESTIALLKKKLFIDMSNVSLSKFGRFYQKTTKPKRIKHPVSGIYKMTEPKEVVRFSQSDHLF